MSGGPIWKSIRWVLVSQVMAWTVLRPGIALTIEEPQTYRIFDLGTLGGDLSEAYGINNAGQVAGYGGINAYGPQFREFTQGFIWTNGSMQPLGAVHCSCSFNERYGTSAARAISGQGRVVGESVAPTGTEGSAFLWEDGAMSDLGTLAGDPFSQANGINGRNQIVGRSGTRDGASSRAFLWRAGVMRDLNSLLPAGSGWVLWSATAINDVGQIVGVGLHNGRRRAFLRSSSSGGRVGSRRR